MRKQSFEMWFHKGQRVHDGGDVRLVKWRFTVGDGKSRATPLATPGPCYSNRLVFVDGTNLLVKRLFISQLTMTISQACKDRGRETLQRFDRQFKRNASIFSEVRLYEKTSSLLLSFEPAHGAESLDLPSSHCEFPVFPCLLLFLRNSSNHPSWLPRPTILLAVRTWKRRRTSSSILPSSLCTTQRMTQSRPLSRQKKDLMAENWRRKAQKPRSTTFPQYPMAGSEHGCRLWVSSFSSSIHGKTLRIIHIWFLCSSLRSAGVS
jgi:hypothetical protein